MKLSRASVDAQVEAIRNSPKDSGRVDALCIRPSRNQRRELQEADLSPEGGVHGDDWVTSCKRKEADGTSLRAVQLTLMSVRVIGAVAKDRSAWSLAGDQIFVDFDLSEANLPVGQRLLLGEAEIEITDVPHLGCLKFAARFGLMAHRFVARKDLRPLRLRGVYARIVKAGRVKVGDGISKLPMPL